MRYFISVIFFFLICSITCAQDIAKTRGIISTVIDAKNVTYQDRVSKVSINSMREAIQLYKAAVFYSYKEDSVFYVDSAGKKKIVSFWDVKRLNLRNYRKETINIKVDSIKFTESEIKYINAEIAMMDRHKWDKGLFADALLISSDKINKIFAKNIFKGWAYLKASMYTGFTVLHHQFFCAMILIVCFIMTTAVVIFADNRSLPFTKRNEANG